MKGSRHEQGQQEQEQHPSARGNDDDNDNETYNGVLVLLTVPVAWGTFEVAVRYVYALEPSVPAFFFSLAYYTVAATALLLVNAGIAVSSPSSSRTDKNDDKTKESSHLQQQQQQQQLNENYSIGSTDASTTTTTTTTDTNTATEERNIRKDDWPIAGGMELGSYLFVGNLLQVVGLQTVTSDRAAFLLQLTTVFVPLAQAVVVDRRWNAITARVWMACFVALAGVGIMGLDDRPTESSGSSYSMIDAPIQSLTSDSHPAFFLDTNFISTQQQRLQWCTGDTLIVLAAVAYTFHCLRLEVFARTTTAVKLAACKASTETVLSAVSVAAVCALATTSTKGGGTTVVGDNSSPLVEFFTRSGQDCLDFVAAITNDASFMGGGLTTAWLPSILLPVIWTGLVPVAYTIAAQSYGQSRVRPVTANLIYTVQPLGTALFAYLLLHETLGPAGYVGGALIGSAVLLVVLAPESDDN